MTFENPFRPGAGHMPPYLAGRSKEDNEFRRLLSQGTITENCVLTGLRGVGKTVLLESWKPAAIQSGWLWAGTDMSESACVSERALLDRLCADLSVVTSGISIRERQRPSMNFVQADAYINRPIDYSVYATLAEQTPGLVADKLRAILELATNAARAANKKGLVVSYDEAQNLSDRPEKEQYPLSMLLDTVQYLQRTQSPLLLVLTGLPTLFPRLVDARTFSERMFHVVTLESLDAESTREAIRKPIEDAACPLKLSDESVSQIVALSGGYPYFIQFICHEVYDSFIQKMSEGARPSVPVQEIIRKLDSDFFAARWARLTDRQRELLAAIAFLDNCDNEFTVQEIASRSKAILQKPFSSSHVSQMLSSLSDRGIVFKNRHGKYSYAVPLFSGFIRRQLKSRAVELALNEDFEIPNEKPSLVS